MIINVYWEFDLRYLSSQGDLKQYGIETLNDYDELHEKDSRRVYEKFAYENDVPLRVDLSRYWREPENVYEADITELLEDKWRYSVKSWVKEWYIEDHIEDHIDFIACN